MAGGLGAGTSRVMRCLRVIQRYPPGQQQHTLIILPCQSWTSPCEGGGAETGPVGARVGLKLSAGPTNLAGAVGFSSLRSIPHAAEKVDVPGHQVTVDRVGPALGQQAGQVDAGKDAGQYAAGLSGAR